MKLLPETTMISCADKRQIALSVFHANISDATRSPHRGVLVINSATGVKRSFYDALANYFAGRGFTVVTWDARGIGESRTGAPAADTARMRDWGTQDLEAILTWVAATLEPNWAKFTVLGHSSGGHLAALAPSLQRVPRLVLIASGTCYWRRYPLAQQPRMLAAWCLLVPLMLHVFKGYMPGSLGVGHDLPKGVAQDWRDWSLMTEYLFDDASVNSAGYGRFPGRIYARGFSDDTGFAPPAAVAHLLSKFTSAQIDSKIMTPADVGASRIGHFGYFRNGNDALWQALAEWIEADIKVCIQASTQ